MMFWQKPSGELIIVDVKATSKNVFDWEDTYSKWEYAKRLSKATRNVPMAVQKKWL